MTKILITHGYVFIGTNLVNEIRSSRIRLWTQDVCYGEFDRHSKADAGDNQQLTQVSKYRLLRLQEMQNVFFRSAKINKDYNGFMSKDVIEQIPNKQMNDSLNPKPNKFQIPCLII